MDGTGGDNLECLNNVDEYQRHKLSVSTLHLSALDIVTNNMDSTQRQKHKDTINKKYVFVNYL